MAEIDLECEKAMIQFIFHHRAIRLADLDTVWKAFLRVYPFCEEIEVSDIKLHFLCMDMSSNVWDLDEEVFLYAKYAADLDEDEQEPENLTPTSECSILSSHFSM